MRLLAFLARWSSRGEAVPGSCRTLAWALGTQQLGDESSPRADSDYTLGLGRWWECAGSPEVLQQTDLRRLSEQVTPGQVTGRKRRGICGARDAEPAAAARPGQDPEGPPRWAGSMQNVGALRPAGSAPAWLPAESNTLSSHCSRRLLNVVPVPTWTAPRISRVPRDKRFPLIGCWSILAPLDPAVSGHRYCF